MIISKTPYRISFFGGGTDYPAWYREYGGSTLVTSIDYYCYQICRYLPPFFENKHRIVYAQIELVNSIEEIQHPAVKGVLSYLKMEKGMEVIHYGDLPSRSGLGSSSAFTVGLINAALFLEGKSVDKEELAKMAIHVEQNVIGEAVGSQDQIAAAFGGINRIFFHQNGSFSLRPVSISNERLKELEDNLCIVFSGVQRTAADAAIAQIQNIKNRKSQLMDMLSLVDEGEKLLLASNTSLDHFGKLLADGWKIKRTLSDKISFDTLDDIYSRALKSGATGGKLLGAGGGGFLLFYVPKEIRTQFESKMSDFVVCPVKFENLGSHIIT